MLTKKTGQIGRGRTKKEVKNISNGVKTNEKTWDYNGSFYKKLETKGKKNKRGNVGTIPPIKVAKL